MDLDEILDDWIKIDKNKIHTCYGFIDKWFEHVLQKAIYLEKERDWLMEELRRALDG